MPISKSMLRTRKNSLSLKFLRQQKKKLEKIKKSVVIQRGGYLSTRIRMWWFLWSWHFFYTGKRVVFQVITGCLFFVVKKHSMKVHCSPSHKFRDKVSQHTCIPIHIHVHRPFCNMKTVIGLLKLSRFFFIKLWHFCVCNIHTQKFYSNFLRMWY